MDNYLVTQKNGKVKLYDEKSFKRIKTKTITYQILNDVENNIVNNLKSLRSKQGSTNLLDHLRATNAIRDYFTETLGKCTNNQTHVDIFSLSF